MTGIDSDLFEQPAALARTMRPIVAEAKIWYELPTPVDPPEQPTDIA
jgi:hypothetical protein